MDRDAFENWRERFRAHARSECISEAVLRKIFDSIEPLARIVEHDGNQSEFVRPIWDYLDIALSDKRIEEGRKALHERRNLLQRIESTFGVPSEIVTAIWGMETSYGAVRGTEPVPSALATLSFDGRRGAFFETELLAALRILDAEDVTPEGMLGSWAGAMGHTQFMPSTFLSHAVDFDGDGRRDIWSDDPTDALASTAAYLAASGWNTGGIWGIPVGLGAGFDVALADRETRKPVEEWARLGVTTPLGIPPKADACILLPAGFQGPAFMVFANFAVLRTYNRSDAYVLAVGLLADAIAGADRGPLAWPRDLAIPDRRQMRELQRRLTEAGYDTHGSDGLAGPNTSAAIRTFQKARGEPADGFATVDLLEKLRRSPGT